MMYGAGMADSNSHAPIDIPMLLAGGGAGQLKGGRHIRFKNMPLANLHLTLLDQLGVHRDQIGDSTGRVDAADPVAVSESEVGAGLIGLRYRPSMPGAALVALVAVAVSGSASRVDRSAADRGGQEQGRRRGPRAAEAARRRQRAAGRRRDRAALGRRTATTWRSPTLLIRAGARANAANDIGATPLHLACTNRSAPMVERLLAAGANPNAALLNGETVLMTCARAGDARAVKALLARGADVNAKEREHDQTALMWAAAQRHPEVVQLLIEAGADVRARSRTYPQTVVGEQTQRAGREELNYTVLRGGATPLLFAARVGDVESARLLLKAGADANDVAAGRHQRAGARGPQRQRAGRRAAARARRGSRTPFGSGYTALHAAILRSDLNLVKALLAHGANPNVRIDQGHADAARHHGLQPAGDADRRRRRTCWRPGSSSPTSCGRSWPAAPIRALTMPNGATPLMLAAGMGSSRTASRRGIETIDFGKVEPESRVREAVPPRLRLRGDVERGEPDRRHRAARRGGARATTPSSSSSPSTARSSTRRTGAASRRCVAAMFGSTVGRGRAAAPAGADSLGFEPPVELAHPTTVALLKKLGATE